MIRFPLSTLPLVLIMGLSSCAGGNEPAPKRTGERLAIQELTGPECHAWSSDTFDAFHSELKRIANIQELCVSSCGEGSTPEICSSCMRELTAMIIDVGRRVESNLDAFNDDNDATNVYYKASAINPNFFEDLGPDFSVRHEVATAEREAAVAAMEAADNEASASMDEGAGTE